MHTTMTDYLSLAQRYLPVTFQATSAYAQIVKLANLLPPLPLTIFESPLHSPDPAFDFLMSAPPDQILRIMPPANRHDAWRELRQLCTAWQDAPPTDPLRQDVQWIWLEFDTTRSEQDVLVPGIYFVEGFARYDKKQVCMEHLANILHHLLLTPPSAQVMAQFTACFQALPAPARLFSLGNKSGRAEKDVRVSIAGLSAGQVPGFLHEIGWPGEPAEVSRILTPFSPYYDRLALDLDVGDQIGPKLGFEFYMRERHSSKAWDGLFDALETAALCTPAKRQMLQRWPGFSNAHTDADIWPAHLAELQATRREENHFLFVRRLNHVKLSYHPQQPPQAKGYIALQRLWTRQKPLAVKTAVLH